MASFALVVPQRGATQRKDQEMQVDRPKIRGRALIYTCVASVRLEPFISFPCLSAVEKGLKKHP